MATMVEGNTRTFVASAAIDQFLRVKLSSGQLAAAGADDIDIGTLEEEAFASGDVRAVRLASATGTRKMVASEAISLGAKVYGAASGKIADTGSGRTIGIALEAATADGDIIEVLYDPTLVGATIQFAELAFTKADMTDNADATGFVDFATGAIPAAAMVLGWECNCTVAFSGDTSAVVQVGISGNLNLYSAFTAGSIFAAAKVGSNCQVSTDNPYQAAAQTPRVTITGATDFGLLNAAGAATVRIAFVTF